MPTYHESADVAVITAAIGERDELRDDQETEGGRFIAYVDRTYHSRIWTECQATLPFHSSRRNSRIPKILIHQYCNARYSIWIDACIAIKVPARKIIEDFLGDSDIAVFRHETRNCTYEEGRVCATRQLDDPTIIESQMNRYRENNLLESTGLARCSLIARRHSSRIEQFNNSWWSEYCCYSVRDQLSFMFAVRNTNVKVSFINEPIATHPYFSLRSRPAQREPHPLKIRE